MNKPRYDLRLIAIALVGLLAMGTAAADKFSERVKNSTEVYKELINAPDQGVPKPLLKKCKCVAVLPGVKKGAFVVGGRHGKGIVSCRNDSGKWSPIAFLTLSGGSFGFQIGGSSTDLVLFLMSERGAKALLDDNIKLGANASVAAGPVGRTAEAATDIKFEADVYAYARAKGLFAGIALDGASLRRDGKAVRDYYGQDLKLKELLFEHQAPKMPAAAKEFVDALP